MFEHLDAQDRVSSVAAWPVEQRSGPQRGGGLGVAFFWIIQLHDQITINQQIQSYALYFLSLTKSAFELVLPTILSSTSKIFVALTSSPSFEYP